MVGGCVGFERCENLLLILLRTLLLLRLRLKGCDALLCLGGVGAVRIVPEELLQGGRLGGVANAVPGEGFHFLISNPGVGTGREAGAEVAERVEVVRVADAVPCSDIWSGSSRTGRRRRRGARRLIQGGDLRGRPWRGLARCRCEGSSVGLLRG